MKLHAIAASAALTLAVLAPAAQAQVTHTITFDAGDPIGGLAAGAVLSNQYAGIGVMFTPNVNSGTNPITGEDWASNTDMTIVTVGGGDTGGLGTPSLVSGNILHSYDGWSVEDGDPSFAIDFSAPITSFSIDVAGVFETGSTTITLFNGATQIGFLDASAATGGQATLSFSAASITRVVVGMGEYGDWVGVDNITFTTAVPEPGTWLLMGLGLAGVAGLARRRSS